MRICRLLSLGLLATVWAQSPVLAEEDPLQNEPPQEDQSLSAEKALEEGGKGLLNLFNAVGDATTSAIDAVGKSLGNSSSSDDPSEPREVDTKASAAMGHQVRATPDIPEAAEVPPVNIPYDRTVPQINVVVSDMKVGVGEIPPVVGTSVTAQMTTALTRIKNLTVIDREASAAIAAELQFSKSALAARGSNQAAVQMPVADYIVRGVVTEFSQFAKGSEDGVELELGVIGDVISMAGNDRMGTAISLGNPSIGNKAKWLTGMVKMDIKVIDVRRGSIVDVIEAAGAFTSLIKGSQFGLFGFNSSSKQFAKSVLGQATRAAVNDGAVKIYTALKSRTVTTKVVDIRAEKTALKSANIRTAPSTKAPKLGELTKNQSVRVTGRTADNRWYRIALSNNRQGFVYAPLIGDASSSTVPVLSTPQKAPPPKKFSINKEALQAASGISGDEALELAQLAHSKGNMPKAAKWYRIGAEAGHPQAQLQYANLLRKGEGVDKDFSAAAMWYGKAAERGEAAAQYNLGIMYGLGLGVEEDPRKAETWLRKAAAQGHPKAQEILKGS